MYLYMHLLHDFPGYVIFECDQPTWWCRWKIESLSLFKTLLAGRLSGWGFYKITVMLVFVDISIQQRNGTRPSNVTTNYPIKSKRIKHNKQEKLMHFETLKQVSIPRQIVIREVKSKEKLRAVSWVVKSAWSDVQRSGVSCKSSGKRVTRRTAFCTHVCRS